MSPTQYKALTAAIRAGSLVMRGGDFDLRTLISLQNRGWASLVRVTKNGRTRVEAAEITTAGRHAVARFAAQHGQGVDPHPFPKPLVLARLGIPTEADLLNQLLPE
jgi:hypothetical protein